LPFPLVADTDKSINQKYGVWVEKERDGQKYMGTARVTFVIDEKGVITNIIDKVEYQAESCWAPPPKKKILKL
jgi:peroxiredoxin Q/BCP